MVGLDSGGGKGDGGKFMGVRDRSGILVLSEGLIREGREQEVSRMTS